MLKKIAILLDPATGATATGGGGGTPGAVAPAAAAPVKTTPAAPGASADAGEPNPFDALDGMIAKSRGKEPAKEPAKEPDNKDAAAPAKEAPTEKKESDKAVPDAARRIESGPKALRDQLEKTNGELKTHKEKVLSLEAKIQEYETKGKDTTTLSERLTALEKEKDGLQSELRMFKREASPEFKEKYEKPFKRAADVAEGIVKQLKVLGEKRKTDANGEEITVMEPVRDANWDDFVRIFNLPYGQAQEESEKLFGKAERVVMTHWERLHGLQSEKDAALTEERANWKAREEKDQADAVVQEQHREKQVAEIGQTWIKLNQELAEKHADIFAASPKEADEQKIVREAHALFDAKPKTMQQQMVKDAYIRNHLAASYLARHRLNKAGDRIAELEAALAEAKGSKPGSTRRPGGEHAEDSEARYKTEEGRLAAIREAIA